MHSEKLLTRIEAKDVCFFLIKTNRSFGYDKNYFNVMKNWVGTLCKPSAHIFSLYLKKDLNTSILLVLL